MSGDASNDFIREYLVIELGKKFVDDINSKIDPSIFYDSLSLSEKKIIESRLKVRQRKQGNTSIGQFLKQKLFQQNMTLSELEKKSGIDISYLSKVTSNNIVCDKYRLIKISLILNCTYDEIMWLMKARGVTLDYSTKDQVISICLECNILNYEKVEDAVKKYAGEYI